MRSTVFILSCKCICECCLSLCDLRMYSYCGSLRGVHRSFAWRTPYTHLHTHKHTWTGIYGNGSSIINRNNSKQQHTHTPTAYLYNCGEGEIDKEKSSFLHIKNYYCFVYGDFHFVHHSHVLLNLLGASLWLSSSSLLSPSPYLFHCVNSVFCFALRRNGVQLCDSLLILFILCTSISCQWKSIEQS